MRNNSSSELEGVISQMLKPLEGISLGIVIEGLSGYRIIPFNKKSKDDNELLKELKAATKQAMNELNHYGIAAEKAADASASIEPLILAALNNIGFEARPSKSDEEKESAGYPAIEFIVSSGG